MTKQSLDQSQRNETYFTLRVYFKLIWTEGRRGAVGVASDLYLVSSNPPTAPGSLES